MSASQQTQEGSWQKLRALYSGVALIVFFPVLYLVYSLVVVDLTLKGARRLEQQLDYLAGALSESRLTCQDDGTAGPGDPVLSVPALNDLVSSFGEAVLSTIDLGFSESNELGIIDPKYLFDAPLPPFRSMVALRELLSDSLDFYYDWNRISRSLCIKAEEPNTDSLEAALQLVSDQLSEDGDRLQRRLAEIRREY